MKSQATLNPWAAAILAATLFLGPGSARAESPDGDGSFGAKLASGAKTTARGGADLLFVRPVLLAGSALGLVQYLVPVAPALATTSRSELGPAFTEMVTKPLRAIFTTPLGEGTSAELGRMDGDYLERATAGWLFGLLNVAVSAPVSLATAATDWRSVDDRWEALVVDPSRYTAGLLPEKARSDEGS